MDINTDMFNLRNFVTIGHLVGSVADCGKSVVKLGLSVAEVGLRTVGVYTGLCATGYAAASDTMTTLGDIVKEVKDNI